MNNHRESITMRKMGLGLLTLLLIVACRVALRAQFTSGSSEVLGSFLNPTTVTSSSEEVCNYNVLRIDLAQGKVFAFPRGKSGGIPCNAAPVDVTAEVFGTAPAGPIADGVLDVTDFTLRPIDATLFACAPCPTLEFVPNGKNTPVILRAAGNVDIQGNTVLSVAGQPGARSLGLLRGQGGTGGPSGYRGGDGGNGGVSPSAGAPGFGPGGGPGGAAGAKPLIGAKFLTTGAAIDPDGAGPLTAIPAGNDLVTLLRGGSGGGGGGGGTEGGDGGGGGGGALLIAATGAITVSGTITAQGGANGSAPNIPQLEGNGGTGGVIRLVATTITGGGPLNASFGCNFCGANSAVGLIRLEAFTITYTGTLTGNVQSASTPGLVIIPTDTPPAFIRFASITDTNNTGNTVAVSAGSQIFGQTGSLNPTSVTMPNPGGILPVSVKVLLEAGPNTGPPSGFPSAKVITLVVTPIDPAAGPAANYTANTTCPAPTAPCTAEFTGVILPPGVSSLSAFSVLNLSSGGALARMFPTMHNGEPIESVRVETDGRETKYVLIATSGKEFPYKPQ